MMRFSLNFRLVLGLSLLGILFLAQGATSWWSIQQTREAIAVIADREAPALEDIHAMDLNIRLQEYLSDAYGKAPDPEYRTWIARARLDYSVALESFKHLEGDDDWEDAEAILVKQYDAFVAIEDRLMAAADHLIEVKAVPKVTETAIEEAAAQVEEAEEDLDQAMERLNQAFVSRIWAVTRQEITTSALEVHDLSEAQVVALSVLATIVLAVAILVALVLRRGIASPLSRLNAALKAVSEGDLSRTVTDSGIREFTTTAQAFNSMAARLRAAEEALRNQVREQGRILDSIPVALVVLGPDGRLGQVHSAAAPEVLGTDRIAGTKLVDLLYPDSDAQGRKDLERYLKQLFENTSADADVLREINPISEFRYRQGTEEKRLEISFERILADQKVTGVLVNLVDHSEVIRAEEDLAVERKARRRDADSIEAILDHGPNQLQAFLSETRENLKQVRTELKDLSNPEAIHQCFRRLHGIKGSAASLGIETVAFLAHEAETIFETFRSGQAPEGREILRVNLLLGSIGEELDSIENLVGRLKDLLVREEKGGQEEGEGFVQGLDHMVRHLGKTLTKELAFEAEVQVPSLPHFNDLRQIVVHLIRNAADHGIEDSYERLFKGKKTHGTIKLSIKPHEKDQAQLVVEVSDDGAGLDYRRIEAKARALGLLADDAPAPPPTALLRYLFRPGFSTASQVSEISGRGVGLDLVKEMVDRMGGTVQVASEPGKGTRFRILVPFSSN